MMNRPYVQILLDYEDEHGAVDRWSVFKYQWLDTVSTPNGAVAVLIDQDTGDILTNPIREIRVKLETKVYSTPSIDFWGPE